MLKIGQFIKEKRNSLGYSQIKLGNLCGVSDSEIMRIEKGHRKKPDWNILCKIAKALGFSPLLLLLKVGYITENDISPESKITGLERLSKSDIEDVQLFVDFLILKKNKTKDVSMEV